MSEFLYHKIYQNNVFWKVLAVRNAVACRWLNISYLHICLKRIFLFSFFFVQFYILCFCQIWNIIDSLSVHTLITSVAIKVSSAHPETMWPLWRRQVCEKLNSNKQMETGGGKRLRKDNGSRKKKTERLWWTRVENKKVDFVVHISWTFPLSCLRWLKLNEV